MCIRDRWWKHTGKPFVFAFWAVREEALGGSGTAPDAVARLAEVFQRSRDHGLAPESVQSIATEWAPRLGMSVGEAVSYLTVNIHYFLDKPCMEGLQLFYGYVEEFDALPREKLSAN